MLSWLRSTSPLQRALALAAASDAISFGTALLVPVQIGVDVLTAVLLFTVLGFRWPLLGGLLVEATPAAVFPTWTLAVGALLAAAPDVLAAPAAPSAPRLGMGKILDRNSLAAEFRRLKAAGRKAVLTNGVFDLLHVGHLRYLQVARGLGGALAVAVNSDASVKRLKGAGRPILPEAERAELLAGLTCVDYVCVFGEDDPRELIKAATPDVLVKGGDWPVDKILGSDTVLAAGGEVKSLPFVEGRSTSGIVESIKKN